jgi:hypothetical protein
MICVLASAYTPETSSSLTGRDARLEKKIPVEKDIRNFWKE